MFEIIDFTADYHQTFLHPDAQDFTVFITQYGLYEWMRVAIGLKGGPLVKDKGRLMRVTSKQHCKWICHVGPFLQRIMTDNVLAGYVTRICEIYIYDV